MTVQSVAMTAHFPDQLAFVHLDQHGLHLHSFGWYLIPGKVSGKNGMYGVSPQILLPEKLARDEKKKRS